MISSCAKNPVSGMPDFVTITEQQEIEMGRAYHKEILKNSKILKNKELNKYYVELGEKIAKASHRPNLDWKFTIIDDPTMNAFATPGGYVYFYRGLLAHFNSEAELAGVLSHEIAHITARHAVRGMSTAQVTGLLIGLAASRVPGGSISDSGFNLLNVIVNKGYSRKYESEADDIAKDYLGRNGYNQNAMANFLETMKSADELENEIAKKDDKLVLLVGDIGFGIFDDFRKNHPKKFFNLGICEQSLIGVAAGMALDGLKPWVYTITPFLIERPFEQIKLDIDQQNVNVKLVGFADYPTLGPSHSELNAKKLMSLFRNIQSFFPKDGNETEKNVFQCYKNIGPNFISLKNDINLNKNW